MGRGGGGEEAEIREPNTDRQTDRQRTRERETERKGEMQKKPVNVLDLLTILRATVDCTSNPSLCCHTSLSWILLMFPIILP